MPMILSFIVALGVTVLLMPALIRVAPWFKWVDEPNARKVHSAAVPRSGGIAMGIGTIIAIILWRERTQEFMPILFGIAVILFFGGWDDRANLDFRVKFLGQAVAALIVIFAGDVVIDRFVFWDAAPLPRYLSVPFTLFALLGVTNAVNLADGLDGLAGGIMLLSFGAIALLAYTAGGQGVVVIALAAMGSILGFLRFNTHPARVFMGDAGSQFLGFTAGTLAILLTQRVSPSLSAGLPLFLLGVPILDTVLVMGRRVRHGSSPFRPDKSHIHHKLLYLGLDHYEAVLIIYAAQAILLVVGYLLRYQSDGALMVGYGLFTIVALVGFRLATSSGWRFFGRAAGEAGSLVRSCAQRLRESVHLSRFVFGWVSVCVISYVVVATLLSGLVSRDLAILAGVLFVLLLVIYLVRRGEPYHLLERIGLYVIAALAVFLMRDRVTTLGCGGVCEMVFFGLLAAGVLVAIMSPWTDRFELTTLDALVLFFVVVVPLVPWRYVRFPDYGMLVIKLIVLFYGAELLVYRYARRPDTIRLFVIACFAAVGLRGII